MREDVEAPVSSFAIGEGNQEILACAHREDRRFADAAGRAAGRDDDLLPLWRATAAAVAGDEVATQGAVRMARAALREGLSAPIVDIAAGLDPAPALTEALAR